MTTKSVLYLNLILMLALSLQTVISIEFEYSWGLHPENLVKFLEVKLKRLPTKIEDPIVSHSYISPQSASSSLIILPFNCSYKFMSPAPSISSKQILTVTLWNYLSLQNSCWRYAPQTQSFDTHKKSHLFQFA